MPLMSSTPGSQSRPALTSNLSSISALFSPPTMIALFLLLAFVNQRALASNIFFTGYFRDTDDAMRMVELRAWMDGQNWFDMTAYRLDPPKGVFMHWTRLIEVPMALLIRLFELFCSREIAERLMRLVFPMIMLASVLYFHCRIAQLLTGSDGPALIMALIFAKLPRMTYFEPGRIDHDHFSILILMGAVFFLLQALDPLKSRFAALAGCLIAIGLSVSLETLPAMLVATAIFPVAWILQGEAMRPALLKFSFGLVIGLTVSFLAVTGPRDYFVVACDKLSVAHVIPGLIGAVLLGVMAWLSPRLHSLFSRVAIAAPCGIVTIVSAAVTYPECLSDPYKNLDPLISQLWLSNVMEARALLQLEPRRIFLMSLIPLLGLIGLCWAVLAQRGLQRSRWIAIIALTMAAITVVFWQVRGFGIAEELTVYGGLWLAFHFMQRARIRGSGALLPALIVIISFTYTVHALGLIIFDKARNGSGWISATKDKEQEQYSKGCDQPQDNAILNSLPASLVLSSIDMGSYILAHSHHSVIAAPYHRDQHGIRLAIDIFGGDIAMAKQRLVQNGIRYVFFCPEDTNFTIYNSYNPDGLAALLVAEKNPDWLVPVSIQTPYRVYEVR